MTGPPDIPQDKPGTASHFATARGKLVAALDEQWNETLNVAGRVYDAGLERLGRVERPATEQAFLQEGGGR